MPLDWHAAVEDSAATSSPREEPYPAAPLPCAARSARYAPRQYLPIAKRADDRAERFDRESKTESAPPSPRPALPRPSAQALRPGLGTFSVLPGSRPRSEPTAESLHLAFRRRPGNETCLHTAS